MVVLVLAACAGLWRSGFASHVEAANPPPAATWPGPSPFAPGPDAAAPVAEPIPMAETTSRAEGDGQPSGPLPGAGEPLRLAAAVPAPAGRSDRALAGFESRLDALVARHQAGGSQVESAAGLHRLNVELMELIAASRVPQDQALAWKAALLQIEVRDERERQDAMARWFEQLPPVHWMGQTPGG
jgi:hypothetical protein